MKENKTITVFLVDDSVFYMKSLEITFSSKPYYNVHTFATGEACLEKLHLNPDIIILDYYLNSKNKQAANGLEILKKIRAVNPDVPVIMLSTSQEKALAQDCLNNKATEFIIKSDISMARLREIITGAYLDKSPTENVASHLYAAIHQANN